MKTTILKLSVAIMFSIFITSCSNDTDGIYEEALELNDVSISYTVIEYQIFDLLNKHREELGLQSLNIMNLVSVEAENHTNYMIEEGVPSHDNFAIRYSHLVKKVNAKSVGENVAYGYATAEGVVNAWINSPRHRSIIENEKYTDFGISTKKNADGRNYFTNIFVTR